MKINIFIQAMKTVSNFSKQIASGSIWSPLPRLNLISKLVVIVRTIVRFGYIFSHMRESGKIIPQSQNWFSSPKARSEREFEIVFLLNWFWCPTLMEMSFIIHYLLPQMPGFPYDEIWFSFFLMVYTNRYWKNPPWILRRLILASIWAPTLSGL